VLEHVTQLAEKSLVVIEAAGERYRLLETVRQYAHERLNESHEADEYAHPASRLLPGAGGDGAARARRTQARRMATRLDSSAKIFFQHMPGATR